MTSRTVTLALATALIASACTGSDVDEPVPVAGAATTATTSMQPIGDHVYLALSLSSTFSSDDLANPLAAVLYNLTTAETRLGPDPGLVQLSWVT